MEISIVGSGYVGTTVAACLADLGHYVVAVDVDDEVVARLNVGEAPIHEPGLDELIAEHTGGRLTATTEYAVIGDTEATFLALPTPAAADGHVDTTVLKSAAQSVGAVLADNGDRDHLVIVKSTVTPGTTDSIVLPTLAEAAGVAEGDGFDVAVNPEFLQEGSAVENFLSPDKLVFGAQREAVFGRLRAVYDPLLDQTDAPVVETGLREAEMIKYANNAFLAAKVSLINEIGNICKAYGIDAYEVAEAIGLDHRIGAAFLRSGVGWGGSCFPKDLAALIAAARDQGYEPDLLKAVIDVNDRQPERLLGLLDRHVEVDGARVAVLGLAFKPGTDDIRGSRAVPVIEGLLARGASVVAYDPVATEAMREQFPAVEYANSAAGALDGAGGAVVVTEWPEFAELDVEFDRMAEAVVVDGRRIIERRDGIVYEGLTW